MAQAARHTVKSSQSRDVYTEYQQKRRSEALSRQKAARQSKLNLLRLVAMNPGEEMEDVEDMAPNTTVQSISDEPDQDELMQQGVDRHKPRPSRLIDGLRPKDFYQQQFMQPEWMTDIPIDLQTNWYVMPRPEGKRCLVVAQRGRTVARLRNGGILHTFQSQLPGGSPSSRAPGDSICILDAVLHEPDATFYVGDALAWGGLQLAGCSAEMRLFWVAARLAEDGVLDAPVSAAHEFRFCTLPVHPCTPEGLLAAHSAPLPLVRDGLLLLHKEGHYQAGGTPLALLWKDAECSRYILDTDADGVVPEFQHIILKYRMDCTAATDDEPPVVLGRLPVDFAQQMRGTLKPGKLLRFSLRHGGIQFDDAGRPVGADLHFEGLANQRRGRADTFSKIMFQYTSRRAPLMLQQLLEVASTAPMQPDEDAPSSALAGGMELVDAAQHAQQHGMGMD